MTDPPDNPSPLPRTNVDAITSPRPVHVVILVVILILGGLFRFHLITEMGMWPDEFWSSLYMATGRGDAVMSLPDGVLFDPAPHAYLKGAPSWPHVWTSLSSIIHPPVYLILLRWWMDLFGDSDLATRSLSAIASLVSVVLLFELVRRIAGIYSALIAAALLAFSPLQIECAQMARPYAVLELFGILTCWSLWRVEQFGASRGRLAALALAASLTALTHYFAAGALVGLFIYAAVQMRGADRTKTILAMLGTGLVLLLVWGPFFYLQRHGYSGTYVSFLEPSGRSHLVAHLLQLPAALLYGSPRGETVPIAVDVVVFALPLVFIRRSPRQFLWWCWIVGCIAPIALIDYKNRTTLLTYFRYPYLASIGVCALCAWPLPIKSCWRWVLPCAFLVAVLSVAALRLQEGPINFQDWRELATSIAKDARPGEPLVFYTSRDNYWSSPGMLYLAFAHYAPDPQHPVMFLRAPASAEALGRLARFPRLIFVCPMDYEGLHECLPGWTASGRASGWGMSAGRYLELSNPAGKLTLQHD
jgi:uncharacterized membrane protein